MRLHLALLRSLDACSDAVAWAETQPDLKTAWAKCRRGDWMLWLAGRLDIDRPTLVLAACDCAETAVRHCDKDEVLAAVWAIDATRRWAAGETDLEEVRAAAYAADAAAYAAADAAIYAAAYAADAADAAAYAADAAAYAAATAESLAQSARLVRARIPWAVIARAVRERES